MDRIEAVENAKAVLSGAVEWSIMKWLTEKKRVRTAADSGTAALDEAELAVKAEWPEELNNAYAELVPPEPGDPFAESEYEYVKQMAAGLPEEIKALARQVKEADDAATAARELAEQIFSDAESKMSASLARQGAEKALEAYELRYIAIAAAKAARNAAMNGAG
ncbi:MAG TPA: hypothetical protein DEH78_03790 [Solibacterales bacterium]|nr:hypothetical protein [Bryobacterales bacterium]